MNEGPTSSNATTRAAPSKGSQPRALKQKTIDWFASRKISPETLAKLPVGDGIVFFPELKAKTDAAFFKYDRGGWKARSLEQKAFTSEPGFKPHFWNLDNVLQSNDADVYICEGELDACALIEAGLPPYSVLATPSAAVGKEASIEYVQTALAEGLNTKRRFIWCGDQDEAGLTLRTAMAKIIGPARFYFVDWPEGIKDANECLIKEGDDFLQDTVVNGRMPWPADGLFRMSELPEAKKINVWGLGFPGWEDKISIAPGMLSVATGHPGHGKTTLLTQIWYQVVSRNDLVACVASFETRPKPKLRQQLRTLYTGKPEIVLLTNPDVTTQRVDADGKMYDITYRNLIKEADAWIEDHYLFLVHPDRRPNLKWLLDNAEIAVVRGRAKILQIDPFNRMEAAKESGESETDYIGRVLREVYNFAQDFDCHVQIVAHPSKMSDYRRGDPPELEDISGSKHWDNMPDQGFVIHRPRLFDEKGERDFYCEFYHRKARFDELGYATRLPLEFDPSMCRFGNGEGQLQLRKREKKKKQTKDEAKDAEEAGDN